MEGLGLELQPLLQAIVPWREELFASHVAIYPLSPK